MPVDITFRDDAPLYQREQYAKGGIGRIYWDYRDRVALSLLEGGAMRMADIGCGEGITLEKLGRLFPAAECWGIDGLPENLSICNRHGLRVVGASVYELPFPGESFDAVLLFEVIEHLTEPQKAVREIGRVLKPGGKLVMIFPHDSIFRIARLLTCRFREAFFDPGHVRQWTPKSMKRMVESCGFRTMKRRSIPFLFWCFSLHHVIVCRKDH